MSLITIPFDVVIQIWFIIITILNFGEVEANDFATYFFHYFSIEYYAYNI